MNNKGFTIIELISGIFGIALFCGWLYLMYLVIMALQKYIGS